MSSPQKEAVRRHRAKQEKHGRCRLEISVPVKDRAVMKRLAALLRADDARSERLRHALNAALEDRRPLSFAELLESAPPMDGPEFERIRDFPRDVDL